MYGTLRLLTLATLRLPDSFLYAHLVEVLDEDADGDRLRACGRAGIGAPAAGALRLAHRALETHARNVGYQAGAWVDRALEHASALLWREIDARRRCCSTMRGGAAVALTRATAATADDRMRVPEELAYGLAHLLAVYLVATTLR